MAVGDCERVEEHQWEARKLAAGDVGHEEGRRGELRGDLGAAALMAAAGGSGRRGELGSALGARKGVEGKVEAARIRRRGRQRGMG